VNPLELRGSDSYEGFDANERDGMFEGGDAVSQRRKSLEGALVFLCVSLLGCAAPRKELVFGIYGVPVGELGRVKDAGFNVVTPGAGTKPGEYLTAASKAGVKVLLPSGAFATNSNAWPEKVRRYDGHDATWGWYLIDEPDLHDVPPARVSETTRKLQRQARKPGVVVVASGSAARWYGQDCDLLMVDFYPVPWAPLARFAKEMRLAQFARGEKPFMGVVQAFDWNYFSDVLGQTNDLRTPTIEEVRCMSYMALAMEASGLFFYSFESRDWKLAESTLWPELTDLVKELRAAAPIFEQEPLWWASEGDYKDEGAMYNEVQDGVILSRLYQVAKKTGTVEGGYYFLVINTTDKEVGYTFKLPFSGVTSVRGGNREHSVENGWLARTYAPYEVVIYGPIVSRANPGNGKEQVNEH
jgi:hypothetical protein